MDQCPVLDDQTVVELSREGGFAYIPKLLVRQRFALGEMPPAQREHLCALIRQLLPGHASPRERYPGSGDQRYYRIHIHRRRDDRQTQAVFELLVPESSAPQDLALFWKDGRIGTNG